MTDRFLYPDRLYRFMPVRAYRRSVRPGKEKVTYIKMTAEKERKFIKSIFWATRCSKLQLSSADIK